MRSTLLTVSVFLFSILALGQSYKYRRFNEQDGLNNKFIYTIDQDDMGYLLVGTGEGLFRYDGFQFQQLTTKEGLGDDFISCSLKDSQRQIWFGHGNGNVTRYQDGKFTSYDLSKLATSRINQIVQDNDGTIWAVSQNDGLLHQLPDGTWRKYHSGIEEFVLYSFYKDSKERYWLGTDMGLIKASKSNDTLLQYEFIDEIIETKVSSILYQNGFLTIGTEDSGLFEVDIAGENLDIAEVTNDSLSLSKYIVNALFRDTENNLWISTNNKGFVQLGTRIDHSYIALNEYAGGGPTSVRCCYRDMEGNMWIGTMGEGMLRLENQYFSTYNTAANDEDPTVYSVFERMDTIWYGGFGKITMSYQRLESQRDWWNESNGLPAVEITRVYSDERGVLWAGTQGEGLWKFNSKRRKFENILLSDDNLSQIINDMISFNGVLYVGTNFGLYMIQGDKVVSQFSIQNGLSHNVVKSLFKDSRGRIWIVTHDNQLSYIQNDMLQTIETPYSNMLLENKCIAEDNDGQIWIGTDGSGVFLVNEKEMKFFDKRNGLYSDYCYSIVCDKRNNLWVGHRGALSKINLLTNTVETIDPGSGYDVQFMDNAVEVMPNGVILFGTNKGLLRYEPDKDQKNTIEPFITFEHILINDSTYAFTNLISLPYGEYKLEIDFIGVSQSKPDRVIYQYWLEGYDTDWSEPTTESFVDFNKLGPGEYTFHLKCFNADGIGGNTIHEFRIVIDKPFWQKWWFLALCIIILILTIRFIIVRREKRLRLNQEYLKRALKEATQEVVEQKEMLEIKNKDITDSILYAKNIQNAMLPSHESLTKQFNDAFVYFKPRDIVSGDFYWVERYENDIVVSCADCTGHGVPGAFMSLIGSTILKEVSNDKSVQSAGQVLERLDVNLREMLTKRGNENNVEDGMDISVFNYNFHRNKLIVSSANRPVILRINGEWIEIKGDRLSIGGSFYTNTKVFSEHEFDVKSGDLIYMFSDGITDQFGGEHGKKLKRSGLFALIEEVCDLPMEIQREKLKECFHSWKGEHVQIDDILVMGIRF